jgi:hypothetical protein
MNKRRFSQTFDYPTIWGYTSETEMYQDIWARRVHVSFISGAPIPGPPQPWNFLHVLAKAMNKYPKFRLNPDCIILGTYEEHHLLDEGTIAQREAYALSTGSADWDAVEMKTQMLIKQYQDMFGE